MFLQVPQCRCQFYGCRELTLEEMLRYFKEFYESDYNGQTSFLAKACIKVVNIKRQRVSAEISKRHCTVQYYLPTTESDHRICQKTLCEVFKITPRRVQMLVEKIKLNKQLRDGRGLYRRKESL